MRRSERGDTIVEVLLAILVVGAVLTGAYITANQSLNNNRASQERSEALKLVEGQIEQVKAKIDQVASDTTHPYFCLNDGNIVGITPAPPAQVTDESWTEYPDLCKPDTAQLYHLAITKSSADTYTVWARWERVGGGENQEIKMVYRVAP